MQETPTKTAEAELAKKVQRYFGVSPNRMKVIVEQYFGEDNKVYVSGKYREGRTSGGYRGIVRIPNTLRNILRVHEFVRHKRIKKEKVTGTLG